MIIFFKTLSTNFRIKRESLFLDSRLFEFIKMIDKEALMINQLLNSLGSTPSGVERWNKSTYLIKDYNGIAPKIY